jgi:hypothetical protein
MKRIVESFEEFVDSLKINEGESKKEIKVGKYYEVDIKSAGKFLMGQQLPILKRMVKNNGDGKVYVVSLNDRNVEIAGSKEDALIGTLKIKLSDFEQFVK